jgi:hypothetical protein
LLGSLTPSYVRIVMLAHTDTSFDTHGLITSWLSETS